MTTQQLTQPPVAAEPVILPVPSAPAAIPDVPAPPVVAPAAVTPPPTPSAPVVPPIRDLPLPGALSPEMIAAQEAIAAREQALEQAQAQLFEQNIVQATDQYARSLETTYGIVPEHARTLASSFAQSARTINQLQRMNQQVTQGSQRKLSLAISLAKQHDLGLDGAESLMRYNSPEEMRMGAQILVSQTKTQSATNVELAALREQVKALTQKSIPAQGFDSGATVGSVVSVNTDNIDKIFMDYERAHPNSPNPYEAQYRKFLSM